MSSEEQKKSSSENHGKNEGGPRRGGKKNHDNRKRGNGNNANGNNKMTPDLEERVVAVNRCAKVVKGGRRFSFSALLVLGDRRGNVGFGLGKAREVPEAIRKAKMYAQQNMITVPIDSGTIPHEVLGEFDAGKIIFRPASDGTGIKAAGACRSILELAGLKNVLTKSLRGSNPHNIIKATFEALKKLRSVEQIAGARGKEAKSLRMKV